MDRFLHVGFDSYVNIKKIIAISPCDADKIRREMQKRGLEKNTSKYWNACGGKEMRTVILMDDGMIVSSSLNTDTLVNRYEDMIRGGSIK